MGAVKRFFGQFRAKLTPADRELIDAYLNETGKFLFFQMSRVDQKHSVTVAHAVIAEVGDQREIDLTTLVQAALLHDIGKVDGEMNGVNRVVAGFVRRVFPALRDKCGRSYRSGWWNVRYGLYVDRVHPLRGSYMAKVLGIEDSVVELIRHHHDPPREGQAPELTILQLADNKH